MVRRKGAIKMDRTKMKPVNVRPHRTPGSEHSKRFNGKGKGPVANPVPLPDLTKGKKNQEMERLAQESVQYANGIGLPSDEDTGDLSDKWQDYVSLAIEVLKNPGNEADMFRVAAAIHILSVAEAECR